MTDVTVYAENSMQLEEANQAIAGVLVEKRNNAKAAVEEMQCAIEETEASGFSTKRLKSAQRRQQRLQDYYHKLIRALEAGYSIIPNVMWGEVVAVRSNRQSPPAEGDMPTQALPVGEGEYVNETPIRETYWIEVDGRDKKRTDNIAINHELEMPMIATKPRIMELTREAMEEKIFDEILVSGSKADPMVIGTVRHPSRPYQQILFVIAWWLDTRTL